MIVDVSDNLERVSGTTRKEFRILPGTKSHLQKSPGGSFLVAACILQELFFLSIPSSRLFTGFAWHTAAGRSGKKGRD